MSGKLRLDLRPFELVKVIESALDVIRPAANAKNIHLQPLLDPAAGPIAGDPDRLQQILWNLLSNAVKFTPKNGRVQVLLQRINSHIELVISDNGIGIPHEFLPHVFERFRQRDEGTARQYGGLGLGLAIVHHLVELHGGTVRVASDGEGKGSSFIVRLPVMITPSLNLEPDREHPTAGGSLQSVKSPPVGGLRILVLEDETDARDVIATILGKAHAEVKTVSNAPAALKLLDEWSPDVLLSDVGLPQMDGYAFIRAVRARPAKEGGRVPAAALTAYARPEDRLRILSAGFQMHVPKPIQPAELLTVVATLANLKLH